MSVIFDELLAANDNRIGVITLDSPKTLNALSLSIIEAISKQLHEWATDPKISCVFMRSSLGKAFSAGSDVRQVVESCRQHPGEPDELAQKFFSTQYQLDDFLHHYPKPVITWGQGYVLGGGMGLLQSSSIRIVTPTSRLGMPEISIGFFLDVASTWFLSRIPNKFGLFLGLTGSHVNATDALTIGLADRFLLDEQQETLLQGLQQINWQQQSTEQLHQLLKEREQQALPALPETVWQPRMGTIKQLLDQPNLPSVWHAIVNMQQGDDEVLAKSAKTLADGSPVTAWLVWEQFHRLARSSVSEILKMDYTISLNCARFSDFTEGVRARLIDRDNDPNWQWKTIEEVPYDRVNEHFTQPF